MKYFTYIYLYELLPHFSDVCEHFYRKAMQWWKYKTGNSDTFSDKSTRCYTFDLLLRKKDRTYRKKSFFCQGLKDCGKLLTGPNCLIQCLAKTWIYLTPYVSTEQIRSVYTYGLWSNVDSCFCEAVYSALILTIRCDVTVTDQNC